MATVELSVFGLGSQIDVTNETLALAGVVGFTVAFEMAAHRLEHRLAGTPYMGMLAKIYKGTCLRQSNAPSSRMNSCEPKPIRVKKPTT